MPIVKLNADFISNHLQCPEGKRRIEYVSDERSGLYIEVRATSPGQGTYYLRYKDETNKTCHKKIGRTTDIDLADARREAKKLKAEIALGGNPREEEKARKAVPTLTEFMEDHYIPYVKPRKKNLVERSGPFSVTPESCIWKQADQPDFPPANPSFSYERQSRGQVSINM